MLHMWAEALVNYKINLLKKFFFKYFKSFVLSLTHYKPRGLWSTFWMRKFWCTCLPSNYALFLKQKDLYLCFQEQKTDLIYLEKNTFYKIFSLKNKNKNS